MTIISVDPGLKGALVAITEDDTIAYTTMPVSGKEIDLPTVAQWIKTMNPQLVVIEKVGSMPKQGLASTFKFGKGYGAIQGICAALNVPIELVTPQRWKKTVLAGTKKDKSAAIAYCRRAFPEIDLVQPRCRTPHDGVADALCILQFGRREFQNYKAEK